MGLSLTKHTFAKIDNILSQIGELKSSDFAHRDALEALNELEKVFERDKSRVENLPGGADQNTIMGTCLQANRNACRLLPILGFLRRSSSIRNSFEFFEPTLRLCRDFIGGDAKLVFSSEWNYSPLTYALVISELPKFVLIGLPASESANSLVIPLAGHELGHSVWRHNKLDDVINPSLRAAVLRFYQTNWPAFEKIFGNNDVLALETDMFLLKIWSQSFDLAIRQCQEIFCDFIGVRVFAESYLHSFEYLLSPSFGGFRDPKYPFLRTRAQLMMRAADHFGVAHDPYYAASFNDYAQKTDAQTAYVMQAADGVVGEMVDWLLAQVEALCIKANVPTRNKEFVEAAENAFVRAMPIDDSRLSFTDIINAGWQAYNRNDLWIGKKLKESEKWHYVNELVFKSVETLEFWNRVGRR